VDIVSVSEGEEKIEEVNEDGEEGREVGRLKESVNVELEDSGVDLCEVRDSVVSGVEVGEDLDSRDEVVTMRAGDAVTVDLDIVGMVEVRDGGVYVGGVESKGVG